MDCPVVLDADALNLIAGDKALLTTLLHRTVATVLTPHEAEGARLLKVTPQIIQSDRVNAVRDIALQTGAITVLKGPGTLIAMRSSRTWLSPYATASLATAGSGDVLLFEDEMSGDSVRRSMTSRSTPSSSAAVAASRQVRTIGP